MLASPRWPLLPDARMAYQIELSADAERDFGLIFDHLYASYSALGESVAEALDHAERRTLAIRAAVARIALAPHRGERHDRLLPGLRHLSIERAIYWFEVDGHMRRVRVLAVFFGGQDHIQLMLERLLPSE